MFLLFWLLRPGALYGLLALSLNGIRHGYLWQPLTYMFLHGGFTHLLFNMFTLYFLGPETERAMGSKHFLAMYLLSGLLGGLGWIWLSPQPYALCVGASGAIYGVLAAFATLYPRRQLTLLIFFIFPVTLLAWQLVAGLAFIEFVLANNDPASGIAHTAHLPGPVAGFLYIDHCWKARCCQAVGRVRDYVALSARAARRAAAADQRIDRILDKIPRSIQSLTKAERQTLHQRLADVLIRLRAAWRPAAANRPCAHRRGPWSCVSAPH